MTVYIDEVTATSGTTANIFGTNVTITLNAKSRYILAYYISGCDTVFTAAQGGDGVIMSLNSSSLSLSDQRWLTPPFVTSGPATNCSGQSSIQHIIPVTYATQGNEVLTFATAPDVTITTGVSSMISVAYCDTLPPSDWAGNFPDVVPSKGGYVSAAQQLTTTQTALTTINVPTWVQEFISSKSLVLKAAAITAAQYEQAYFALTSSIPDISPMKIITNSDGSTLGTPVGTGMFHDFVQDLPIYFQNAGGAQTLIPNVNLLNAVSTGNQVMFSVQWR